VCSNIAESGYAETFCPATCSRAIRGFWIDFIGLSLIFVAHLAP
jgi:hypothetical protein